MGSGRWYLRALLNYDGGAINNLLVSIGFERLDFYNDPKYWRVILTLCNIWKSAGYNGYHLLFDNRRLRHLALRIGAGRRREPLAADLLHYNPLC